MAARGNRNRRSPSGMTRELEEMSNQTGAGSTYQPTYDTSYETTYDPVWNSRREPRPEPSRDSPLHREYNPITSRSSHRASPQMSSGGRFNGYGTPDSMTSRSRHSASDQRREPNVTYNSEDSREDTRKDKDSDSRYHKKGSSSKEKGSAENKYAKKDRDGKYDRDESYGRDRKNGRDRNPYH